MSQQKSECHYSGCKENLLASAKKGHCIFHARTEEKDTREFHKALENYVNRIKKAKDLDYNFMGFIFVGDIDFRSLLNQSVSKNVSFEAAEFHGTAHFDGIEFQKDFFFNQAEFHHGDVFFSRAKFHGETHFDSTRFEHADFVRVEFHGETHFWATRFGQGTHFMRAKFTARAYFSNSFIRGRVSFASATLENISLTPLNLDEDARIDFADARLRNTEITRQDIEDHIIQEREEFFPQAKEIYLLLKNNFHSLGRYDDESWAFRKEKGMERKGFWHFRKEHTERELGKEWSNKGIKDCFYPALFYFEYTAKYLQDHWLPTSGKKINRLFSYMANFPKHPIGTIKGELKNFASFVADGKKEEIGNMSYKELFRTLWFYIKYPIKYSWSTFLKYLYGWGEQPWLIFLWCGITIFIFSVLYLGGDVIAKDGTLVKSYLDKLYFSGVTFTTLGYGDFSPIGGTRLLAFIESFLGVFFIALFVFSFARRTAGR